MTQPKRRRRSSDFTAPKQIRLRDSDGADRPAPAKDEDLEDFGGSWGPEPGDQGPTGERLQKILARAGFGSRRACEALIATGRVAVDGETVTTQGVRVDPETQVVHVDGRRLQLDDTKLTIALHKPPKVMSTMDDPEGRRSLNEFVEEYPVRLFHVGRLDYETEGLLLLTNDGELAHRLMHPSFEVSKTYVCRFDLDAPEFPRGILKRLRDGIDLEDGSATADRAALLAHNGSEALVEITIHEGRNRIVRRMFEALGHPLTGLVRTRIGPVLLNDLKSGQSRELTGKELGTLMASVGL
ncbi:rRNA pseudouridine synthase [Helcobacillus massiliensis]|uniref:pseudouridine synthase n=1 Tax=Helcobacillus massiliensis TaxID=521392 RepID=UPI0021A5C716|nr:pseudouridine synthase [Helcobacillus massiliensis]MCT1557020.1 rRNA pseudouridine synthase [Helcobacillus massiliensis]MCT2035409.1 rRNA pseudouridine synthase [Helcobacillus massiliensis]MCT2331376.1 rRNA pseudouridine synthase [Helcobacillus massiliensis]